MQTKPEDTASGGRVRCPFCHRNALQVTNSRQVSESPLWLVRRLRFCTHCGKQFPTYEMLVSVYNMLEKARAILAGFQKVISGVKTTDDK